MSRRKGTPARRPPAAATEPRTPSEGDSADAPTVFPSPDGAAPGDPSSDAPGPAATEAPATPAAAPEATAASATAAPRLVLELELSPETAPDAFWRHPALPRRAGRTRAATEEVVWLDGADAPLAAGGLLLERPRRGPPRLVRALPNATGPGAPATPVRDLAPDEAAAPAEASGQTVVPVAAFSGRRTEAELAARGAAPPGGADEGGGGAGAEVVRATLRVGRLRGVATDAPVAWLTLAGPTGAVLALARDLAASHGARPTLATLPEAARAVAQGDAPRSRAAGAPDVSAASAAGDALALAVAHLGEVILSLAPAARLDLGPEAVHGMRVASRRLRSAIRLFRPACDGPALRALDDAVRDLGRLLGAARDLDVFLSGVGRGVRDAAAETEGAARVDALLRAAERRRREAYDALRAALFGEGAAAGASTAEAEERRAVPGGPMGARLALALLDAAHGRPWSPQPAPGEEADPGGEATPLRAHGRAVLAKRWRRLREDGAGIAALGETALHELRLSAKRLRYAGELFAPLWPGKEARRFLKRLAAVQEALGLANDAAVARGLAASLAGRDAGRTWAAGLVGGWALARAGRTRRDALAAWTDLAATAPFWER